MQNPGKINRTLVQLIFRNASFYWRFLAIFTNKTAIPADKLSSLAQKSHRNVRFLHKNPRKWHGFLNRWL